jgi:ketosteroid isomerase-like protein
MAKKKIESMMRDFIETIEKGDVEKTLTFLAEDADYVTPEGIFKGKEELKHYLHWSAQISPNPKIKDVGIGIMVKGNKAVYEHIVEVTYEGAKYEALTLCVYEFSDEKIQHLRTVVDRLSIIKQTVESASGVKAWIGRRVVNYIVKEAEKGLH